MSLQHILKNSSVSGKEPLASQLANGELSINYHADGPFLCCKDTAGNVRRVAGVWVATTAPSTPFPGELWLDTSITPSQLKVYKDTTDGWTLAGSVNSASTTSEGIVRLATNGDTQTGTNATSAVTPASLQSKISDSTSTVSSTTIASSSAVKTLADTVNAALPKSGGTITGTLEIGNTGQIRFEGSSNDAYETTLAAEDPTAPRTITLPDRSGTVITTGDTGTVTNTMLAGSIADSKLSAITTADKVLLSALNIDGATDIGGALSDADLFIVDDGANGTNRKTPATRISDYTFGKVNGAVTIANNGTSSLGTGVIVNSNVSNTAAIAGTKVSPDFGSQNITTTGSLGMGGGTNSLGVCTFFNSHSASETGKILFRSNNNFNASLGIASIYASDAGTTNENRGNLIFATGFDAAPTERLRVDSFGRVGIGTSSPSRMLQVTSAPDTTNPINGADFIIANPGLTPTEVNSTTAGLGFTGLGVNYAGDYHFRSFWGFSIDKGAGNLSSGASNSVNADSRTFAIRQYAGGTTWNTQFCVNGSGNVGIGTSGPTYQLQLSTDSAGKPSTNTWTIVSDERIKEDVELADLDICYQAIKTIPLKRFKWKDEVYTAEQVPDRHKLGWIAQDVEPIFPKAVHIHEFKYNQVFEEIVIPAVEEELDEDGNVVTPAQPERTEKGELVSEEVIEDCRDLNADQLYAAMYGAMQKLIQKVEILEAEVAALKWA